MYTYNATVVRWIDGDTVQLAVDLGFNISMVQIFRLLGIDTPERGEPNYHEARECSISIAPVNTQLKIVTHKRDKYGRWLTEIPQVADALTKRSLLKVKEV